MTHDRKDDNAGSKEAEKSRKTTDLSAPVVKEKTASSAELLPTKVRQVLKKLK